jgi:hypothetical protein
MNYELERSQKETLVASSKYYLGICLEGLRKHTERINQDIRCPGRDSKRAPLEYMCRALPLRVSAL